MEDSPFVGRRGQLIHKSHIQHSPDTYPGFDALAYDRDGYSGGYAATRASIVKSPGARRREFDIEREFVDTEHPDRRRTDAGRCPILLSVLATHRTWSPAL
jgi:hypothetical protein